MIIKTGYVYHIKDEYFEVVKDKTLMMNHENEHSRPMYLCIKEKNSMFLWLVPMSSKITKYENIQKKQIKKYGKCDSIVIGKYRGKKQAFLIQNLIPITEKYISHADTVRNKSIPIVNGTQKKIKKKVLKALKLKSMGINIIFTDIDKIKEILLNSN